MTENELLDLKKKIDEAKAKVNELNGQQSMLIRQLSDYGCKSISEAETKLSIMEKDISALDYKIEQGTKELQSKYNLQ